MPASRPLCLLPLLLLAACDGCHPGVTPDDTGQPPGTDACDDAAGHVLCVEGQAITCDEAGDVAATEECVAGTCEEGVGCVACAVDLQDVFVAEADEESTGLVLVVDPVHPDSHFNVRRLTSRAVDVSAEAGGVTLTLLGDGVILYEGGGGELGSSVTFVPEELPTTVFLAGTSAGKEAALVATHTLGGCEAVTDTLRLRTVAAPDLAGEPLDRYPDFSFVDAFNEGEPVSVAVDPGLLPDRAGATADVYVVQHRDLTTWGNTQDLTDLTGGAETLTVGTTSLADSQVVAGTLDGGDLSLDYDVVLDFDRDGALGPGDLVDHLSDQDAGLYAFIDLSQAGPHAVAQETYSGGWWLGQRAYWPEDVASMAELPLVVISHGNGHDYTWYDYLGEHLASHGYVVMSHQNNTGPGIVTAATTTLTNTDYLLGNLGSIAGGALQGHVDSHRIVWIGHSRGGEGVVMAYDWLRDGSYTPSNFVAHDVVLVSSIAPTVFYSVTESDPHDVAYHLLAGAADGDVTGQPDCTQCQFFRIAGAAQGELMVTYVQGAGHNDFNCCGFDDATGPDQIGRAEAQVVAESTYLALLDWRLGSNEAAGEFLQRMYQDLHGAGIAESTVVANLYRPELGSEALVLDDLQTESGLGVSSCGEAVSYDVTSPAEALSQDTDDRFSWSAGDPLNGMTWADDRFDSSRALSFEWAAGDEAFIEWEVPAGEGDWSDYSVLSFAAAQVTRHPNTTALDGPLDFTVTLVDGAGGESDVSFGAWGGLSTPYKRTGNGAGAGWADELNTVRIPLRAFTASGVALDLADIVAVRFNVGGIWGSATGRVVVDDLEVLP
ncbi:MAG: hypothetical protein ABIO70_36420 [Pseudomonadota bacterium]